MFVFLAVVFGLVLRGMTPEERTRFGHTILAALRFLKDAVTKVPTGSEAFQEALRARTRWTLVTPALVVVQVLIVLLMVFAPGKLADPQTLVSWGASVGPRTTNGEWWRLASAMFVHMSVLHLFATAAGLLQVGLLTERLAGRSAYTVVYMTAGVLAGLWNLSAHPVDVSAGAAGAVFGVYGLLLAALAWGEIHRSPLTVPLVVLKGLWPGAALFLLYHMLTEGVMSASMQAGLVVGFVGGVALLAGRDSSSKPATRRVLATLGTSLVLVVILAAPLRGLADVTVEVARVMEIEARTARAYDEQVARFREGRLEIKALIQLADKISAELRSTSTHLTTLGNVPDEHQPMLLNTTEYLRFRQESWHLRSEGLRTGKMKTLQKADASEHAALESLHKATTASVR